MKALITGSAGFVGHRFRDFLKSARWDVVGIDIKNGSDARDYFHGAGDDYHGKFDLVVHCAAIVGGRKMIDGAPLALASNLELDSSMFQWALRNKPKRVLYFSSSAAYPTIWQTGESGYRLEEKMIDETLSGSTQFIIPDQLYGWTKLTGENLAYRYRQEGGRVSVVRPFSGYGEDQDDCYPFPAFIDRALRGDNPFKIWGNGKQTRDFIHISDIIRACMLMIESDIDGPVNLGTGRATSMTHLARLVQSASGFMAPIEYEASAPSGVAYRVANVELLNKFYQPAITLEEGVARALKSRGCS